MQSINIAYLCWTLAIVLMVTLIKVRYGKKHRRYSLAQVLQPKGIRPGANKPEFSDGVWYCSNCFHIFGKPGLCDRHSAPFLLTRGSHKDLEEYAKKRRLIGSEE